MSMHNVRHTFVANSWLGSATQGLVGVPPGGGTGGGTPPGLVIPADVNPLLNAPGLAAINPNTRYPYNRIPGAVGDLVTFLPGSQASYNVNTADLQFAVGNSIVGWRLSEVISFDMIRRVSVLAHEPRVPCISLFSIAYNQGGGAIPVTYRGQNVSIKISLHRDVFNWSKRPIIVSTTVGGALSSSFPSGIVPPAATNLDIQRAHIDLVNKILQSDVDGLYFDRQSTLSACAAINYTAIVLVGRFDRAYQLDRYMPYDPIKHDVSFLEGGTNLYFEEVYNSANFSAAFGSSRTCLTYIFRGDPGSGNGDQVLWQEEQDKGQLGMSNYNIFPVGRNIVTNVAHSYTQINIEFATTIRLAGENKTKDLQKELRIFLRRNTGGGPSPILTYIPSVTPLFGAGYPATIGAITSLPNVVGPPPAIAWAVALAAMPTGAGTLVADTNNFTDGIHTTVPSFIRTIIHLLHT